MRHKTSSQQELKAERNRCDHREHKTLEREKKSNVMALKAGRVNGGKAKVSRVRMWRRTSWFQSRCKGMVQVCCTQQTMTNNVCLGGSTYSISIWKARMNRHHVTNGMEEIVPKSRRSRTQNDLVAAIGGWNQSHGDLLNKLATCTELHSTTTTQWIRFHCSL